MKKDRVIETMTELPQEFDLEILMEKLIFIEKSHTRLVGKKGNQNLGNANE